MIVILGLASVLRLYQLGHEGLWVDEMNSINDAASYWQTVELSRPLYYVLLNGWMQLGYSDVWLRGLAVVFGIGSVWLTFCLAQRLFNRQTGLVAALLIALSPLFINHSQEIRMYSLSSFLSLLGSLYFLSAVSQPRRLSLLGWAASRLLATLTMPLNILLLLPDALLCSYRWWRRPRQCSGFWLGGLFVVAGALPTLLAQTTGGAAQRFFDTQVVDYSKPGLLQVLGMVSQFVSLWPLRYFLEQSFQDSLGKDELGDASLLVHFVTHLNGPLVFYAGLVLMLLGILGFAIAQIFSRQHSQQQAFSFAMLSAWALLPATAVLALSYLSGSIWFPRYLLGFAPYVIILIAAGFVRLCQWRRWMSAMVGVVYFASVITGLRAYYGPVAYRDDWRTVAAAVSNIEQPGDAIIYYAPPRYQPYSFPRYYSGENDIFLIGRPVDSPILEIDYIRQSLSEIAPTDSRLIVVCWWLCDDEAAVGKISSVLGGDDVVLKQQIRVESLRQNPIEVYLFSQATQLSNAEM